MKILVYLMTLVLFSTAVAQNPTILTGSYITNVFGNSNFVLNPNAQTGTTNVTTVTTTVARSTTTPLVATSEFTVAIGTANGTATWATRAFDAGMKNNNCEARFTYRGFAATSKVHIKQSANTVASLNLTPATDPRIASINFPCGDLSTATTFQVTDTAILAGTNEIGGIYVGLATNMANVAQAEMYGAVQWAGCATPEPVRTGSIVIGNFSGGGTCSSKTLFGKATSSNEADASVTFNNLPAGYYFLQTNTFAYIANPSGAGIIGQIEAYEDTSGAASGRSYVQAQVVGVLSSQPTPSGWFYFSSTANRTFRIRATISNAAQSLNLALGYGGNGAISQFALYRFPSSSELVVTPERQNTFAGLLGYSASSTNAVTSSSWTKLTASATLNRELFGKADTTASNDLSLTIKNLPVGTYEIKTSGALQAQANAAADATFCTFGISDLSSPTNPLGATQVSSYGDASVTQPTFSGGAIVAIYKNTSVADRTFTLFAKRLAGSGNCSAITIQADRPISITVTPLDQPSNSALYVQGPVLGANTGAAIPASYVGYVQEVTRGSDVNLSTTASTFTDITGLSISLDPGVWEIESFGAMYVQGAAGTGQGGRVGVWQITDNSNNIQRENRCGFINSVQANTFMNCFVKIRLLVTTTTTYKARAASIENSGSTTNPTAVQVNATGTALAVLRAVRVN